MAAVDRTVGLFTAPANLAKSFDDFVDGAKDANKAFAGLLSYPFIEQIDITGGPSGNVVSNPTSPSEKPSLDDDLEASPLLGNRDVLGPRQAKTGGLRTLVLDLQQQFRLCTDADVDTARQLQNYGNTVLLLASRVGPQQMQTFLAKAAKSYIDKSSGRADFRAEELEKFRATQTTIDASIESSKTQIQQMQGQLRTRDRTMQKKPLIQRMREMLVKLFALTMSDEDAVYLVASILGVKPNALQGSLQDAYDDTARQTEIIKSLEAFQSKLSDIQLQLKALSLGLKEGLRATEQLKDAWGDITANLQAVDGTASSDFTPDQITQLQASWTGFNALAKKFIDVMTGVVVVNRSITKDAPALTGGIAGTSFPVRDGEIHVMRAVESAALDSLSETAFEDEQAKLGPTDVTARNALAHSVISGVSDLAEARSKLLSAFGPPAVEARLESLTNEYKGLVALFDKLLAIPFVEALQVDNPYHDDDKSQPEKIPVRDLTLKFREMYYRLQDEAEPLIRKLKGLADWQLKLLPAVTTDEPKEGQISVSQYVGAMSSIITRASADTAVMEKRHLAYLRLWTTARNNLTKAINESKQTATTTAEALQAKIREQEAENERLNKAKSSGTLWGIFEAIGAAVCFVAAVAFVPLGTVVFGTAGLVLMSMSANSFSDPSKKTKDELDAMVRALQTALETANTTTQRLEQLQEPMDRLTNAIAGLTTIWSGLTTILSSLNDQMTINKDMFEMLFPIILKGNALSPGVLDQWKSVVDLCEKYILALSAVPAT